ncbi:MULTISPECIES: aminotransferase class I/II-fold pyridoxal phosphate-dependent enzyme [unclassified Acinetobacter]|uniref:aminotransferase class I/II-fold pyridoxal phosphate-dependent enzyme n=1 Tax=unclassified Acinetobacter TaxID=196816 RepID=UPI002934AE7C|nr:MULTISPECIES: aminotransferase class I/II-fold pyridoxal phosphate-dependent enzyme [unclassified Acinetobacter]WOE33290.1 aminotransferase class I/II-fold pyridoxal phosphate-dependent enzyme [Acinetobacter sp. SAAs470]WOE36932.1 aminotransferase class I/II-fold pyridoxal phosphate-dependent enzyme [Acinetobacter sp. SAAs474]
MKNILNTLAYYGGQSSVEKNTFTPWPAPTQNHLNALQRVLDSGKFHRVNHPLIEELESNTSKYCGTQYSRAVSSGSAALHVATDFFANQGEIAIVCALNWPGAVAAISHCGLRPIFVDTADDACIDEISAINHMHKEGVAIVQITHLFGNSAPRAKLRSFARSKNIAIVDDCAQAANVPNYLKNYLNLESDAYVLSGNGAKHLASGELGLLSTNSLELIEHVDNVSLSSSSRNGERIFSPSSLGYNYRPNVFSASIALDRLNEIDEQIRIRRENVNYLVNKLEKLPGIKRLFGKNFEDSSFCSLPMRLDFKALNLPATAEVRNKIVELLAAEHVPISVWLTRPVWEYNPAWKNKYDLNDFPNTKAILDSMFCISEIAPPNGITELQTVVQAFEKVWDALSIFGMELIKKKE